MQLFKGVLTIPASGTTSRISLVPDNNPIPANISITPTNDEATFNASPYGDQYICPPGSPTNIPGAGGSAVRITGFTVTGTPGDTISLAIYYPEQVTAPLVNVTATFTGTADVNLVEIVGVAPTNPGYVNTDIGSTNPAPLALETGGNLALTGSSTALVATTVGTAPTTAKVTTQT